MAWWEKRYQAITNQQTATPSSTPVSGSTPWWEKRYQGVVQSGLNIQPQLQVAGTQFPQQSIVSQPPAQTSKPLFDFSGIINNVRTKVESVIKTLQDSQKREEANKRGQQLIKDTQKELSSIANKVLTATVTHLKEKAPIGTLASGKLNEFLPRLEKTLAEYERQIKEEPEQFALGFTSAGIGKLKPKAIQHNEKAIQKIFKGIQELEVKPSPTKLPIKQTGRLQQFPETLDVLSKKSRNVRDLVDRTSIDIVPQVGKGGLKPPILDFEKAKDVPRFFLSRDTITRNIQKVFGKQAPKVEEFLIDPLTKNETVRVKFVNNLKNNIKKVVIKDLRIKKGSLEDKLTQRYGEKNITLDGLKKTTSKWAQVVKASEYFRQTYDDLLKQVNLERQRFGYNQIPKREDYFRHFQELSNIIKQFGVILREQDLPTGIAGLTQFFKPGKPFTTAELRRIGGKYTESAIGGIENYLDSVSRQMFHIDSVQRARQLEKYIRQSGEADLADIPNFVANLTEYGNLLAGKKANIDRAAESIFGRTLFSLLNLGRRQTSANMIAGNVSSAMTNFIPFTQALATTRKDKFLKGMAHAIFSPFSNNFANINGQESGFLVRRFPQGKISPNLLESTKNKLNWLFETIDKFSAKTIVGGKYFENLSKRMNPEQAMLNADKYAAKVLADRSIGALPNIMQTQSLGILTQFQVEINNILSFIARDIPQLSGGNKIKLANQLGQFLIYSYLFNNLFEKVSGRRPTIDPVYAGLTLMGKTEEGENKNLGERIGRAAKDIKENLPFVGGFTGGRFPISAGIPNIAGLVKGEANPIEEFITKPLTFLASPVGGGLQVKKTIEGIKAFEQGASTTPSGRTRYEIKQTLENRLKTAIFGQYSVPEAKLYFENLGKSKSEIIYKEFKKLKTREEKIELWNKMVKEGKITKGNVSDVKQWFIDEKLGVSEKERKMRSLPVEDRARVVLQETNKFKTREEKNAYIKELRKKKVVTDQVLEQLKILLKK